VKILTSKANILCTHLAPVKIDPIQTYVIIDGNPVLVKPDPEHKSIGRCPFIGVGIKKCTNSLGVQKGLSPFMTIAISGKMGTTQSPVCLDTLEGMTDGVPPVAKFLVFPKRPGGAPDAGQNWIDHS
jgi:hypothetical protein